MARPQHCKGDEKSERTGDVINVDWQMAMRSELRGGQDVRGAHVILTVEQSVVAHRKPAEEG
jgi:hypothetical protein